MPVHVYEASGLPAIDEAVAPLSSLFGGSFDQATVESTAQLADHSIFVTSTGNRYRLERLPDPSVPRSNPAAAAAAALPNGVRRRPVAPPPESERPAGSGGPRRRGSAEPKVPTEDVTQLMSDLRVSRFGASPLYDHSDGGVQAAETLTDGIGAGPSSHSFASRMRSNPYHDPRAAAGPASYHYQQPSYPPPQDYPRQPAYGYQPEYGHQQPVQANPYPFIPPQPAPAQSSSGHHYVGQLQHQHHYLQHQPARPPPPPLATVPSYPSFQEYASPASLTGSSMLPTPASPRFPSWYSPAEVAGDPVPSHFDTQTPIVVHPQLPPAGVGPSAPAPARTPSDRASTGREHVLPGEDVLYDGAVETSPAGGLAGPFEPGHLKAFRNTLSNDLRFHCRVGNDSETHWMKGATAQLVPMYAYDQRSRERFIIIIRDGSGGGGSNGNNGNNLISSNNGGIPSSASPQPGAGGGATPGPCGIYQFAQLQDLFSFQSKLTGETVVLDISSVKWMRLGRLNSRDTEMYSSVRLQIWHEPRSRRTMSSDVASFVTAGTAVSGPLRERTVPNSSRLMVFLGRAEEYIHCFITDDIEIEHKDQTRVKLKPRKSSKFSTRNARPGIKARLESRNKSGEPVGLDISGVLYNPDIEAGFDVYKTFEIEFESSPSQINFIQAWNDVMTERRKQRKRLAMIQEEMKKESFTAQDALAIRT